MLNAHLDVCSKWVTLAVKQKLQVQYRQTWHAEIENLDICYNYRLFKQDFGFESYINDMLPKWRYFMCRFRTLNHRLPIEIGRYARVDRQQRYCSLCNDQRLGDEFHVLLECSALKESR